MPQVARYLNFIDGEWQEPEGEVYFTRKSPINGEPVSIAPQSSLKDVSEAIGSAYESFSSSTWVGVSPAEKSKVMLKVAEKLEKEAIPLAEIETRENGKLIKNSVGEMLKAADYFRYYSGLVRSIHGDWYEPQKNVRCYISKDPVGVCSFIVPWNSPVDLLTRKMAPALAVGCSMVIKPSSLTPGITMTLVKKIDELGLIPKGVINVVAGKGESIGDAMITDERVRKIAFTGSTKVGENVMKLASKGVKRVSLELGGKSPNVIFSDANLDKAVPAAFWAIFRNAGQSCSAGSRLLVEENIHAEFVAKLAYLAREMKIGNPFEDSNDYGPIVSEEQLSRILGFIKNEDSERTVIGGKRLFDNDRAQGLYLEPTIFDNVQEESEVFKSEIFGPVLTVSSFDSEEEAIRLANSTAYGLEAGIWTSNINRALRTADGISSGNISINNYQLRYSEVPFGGQKSSGLGKELGHYGIEAYLESKSVCIDLDDKYQRQIR